MWSINDTFEVSVVFGFVNKQSADPKPVLGELGMIDQQSACHSVLSAHLEDFEILFCLFSIEHFVSLMRYADYG